MKIFIKNMVSLRCIIFVKSELEKLKIDFKYVNLGEVKLIHTINEKTLSKFRKALHYGDLELIDDENTILIEKIINIIIETVHYSEEYPKVVFSTYLSEKLNKNYNKLSKLFSENKGITIEHFIQMHKIERVKELIVYDKMNITEISYLMNYSSVAHLSKQFKQVTGFSPRTFKKLNMIKRNNLEDL
jgi:AraC-like DNA-binding protein